jgi:hypothetical protein
LQFFGEVLDRLELGWGRRRRVAATAAEDHRVGLGRGLCMSIDRDGHVSSKDEYRLDRIAADLDQGDAAAHRNGAGGRVEGDVFFLADLAADVSEHARRQVRCQIADLFLWVEDELVDDDFRVARDRQRRLVGEEKLRLSDAGGADALVADDVMADHQLAARLIRRLAGHVRIDGGSDADLLRVRWGRPTQARHPEGRKHYAV